MQAENAPRMLDKKYLKHMHAQTYNKHANLHWPKMNINYLTEFKQI